MRFFRSRAGSPPSQLLPRDAQDPQVYLEDFGSRQMLVRYMERRVVELSRLVAGGHGLLAAGQG